MVPPARFERALFLIRSQGVYPINYGGIVAEGKGVEPLRLLRSPAFEAGAIANWLVLPLGTLLQCTDCTPT